jgi:ubiquinone/menaquinone biosynthesis C-methylase UbiE
MHLLTRILRSFFYLLYHGFAWAYDFVSNAVSFGAWNQWTSATLPFLQGGRVLELGHGPGHLQVRLRTQSQFFTVGLDESAQMGRLAAQRLREHQLAEIQLVRGFAQHLPFPSASFDTVVSTFPTNYIFDARTLAEVNRVLVDGGRLVVLPVAWPKNRLLAWLFRLTGENPAGALETAKLKLQQPFVEAGFEVEASTLDVRTGLLLVVLSTKSTR